MAAETFGKYQLIKKLATGGMAEVWLAKQTGIEGFNRHVVLKRILPHLAADPDFIQMFLNEAKIASRFNHPNIAQIYDLGERDGQYFITMEFVHGEDLGRVMRKAWASGQWIAAPLALRIAAACCEGLYYAHTRTDESGKPLKVVHRDISPQNILVSFDGSVKLVDFGIAKAADQASVTKMGAIKGKFAYMAPEQASGKTLDSRTDIFAIGLVLYELLTGVRPLKRDSDMATLQAALECSIEPPSVVAEVPPELDEVVMLALHKRADDRYADAREFQMAIEEYLSSQRMVATSVQLSQLMSMLFAERQKEEAKLGSPNPSAESNASMPEVDVVALTDPATPNARAQSGESAAPAPESRRETRDARAVRAELDHARPLLGDTFPPRSISARQEDSLVAMPLSQESIAPERPDRYSRRSSSKSAPHVKTPTTGMPTAPPRQSRSSVEVDQLPTDAEDARRREALRSKTPVNMPVVRDVPAEPASSRPSSQKAEAAGERLRWILVAATAGMVALLLAAKLFWPTEKPGTGTPVLLTVDSAPRVQVTVVPAEKGRRELELGETPINDAKGVFVGDTVLMRNGREGIYYEHLIEFGQPNQAIKIDKTFRRGELLLIAEPKMEGLELWRSRDEKIGVLGIPVELFEGAHRLTVRGGEMSRTIPIDVKIEPGKRTYLKLDLLTDKLKPVK